MISLFKTISEIKFINRLPTNNKELTKFAQVYLKQIIQAINENEGAPWNSWQDEIVEDGAALEHGLVVLGPHLDDRMYLSIDKPNAQDTYVEFGSSSGFDEIEFGGIKIYYILV